MKIYTKAFIGGFSFISFFTTFIVLLAQMTGDINLLVSEITLAAFVFGVWNMFYFFVDNKVRHIPIGLWGALLGLLFGVESLLRPQTHLIHSESLRVLLDSVVNFETFNFIFHGPPSILWLPILYFFVWHYIIRWLNNLWGCECS